MEILFDSQAFNMQKYGGITRYFSELYYSLNKLNDTKVLIGVLETDNIYLQNLGFPSPENFQRSIPNPIFKDIFKSNMTFGYLEYCKNKFDILHSTFYYEDKGYFYAQQKYSLKTKHVTTIHDMIPEIFNWSNGKDIQIVNKKTICENADAIICPSTQTKNDIVKYMPNVNPQKIHVIHHGYNKQEAKYSPVVNYPYILYVGGRLNYKKFREFIIEVKPFLTAHKDFKIICTGQPFNDEELLLMHDLKISDKIINMFVSDEQLANLYHYAFCFVFPSSYEGFGLPILEAWNHNCITLLNDIPVFKEIAGKVSKYFNIDKKGSLCTELEKLYSLTDAQRDLIRYKQNKKLNDYSWEKCAKEHFKVYNDLLLNI